MIEPIQRASLTHIKNKMRAKHDGGLKSCGRALRQGVTAGQSAARAPPWMRLPFLFEHQVVLGALRQAPMQASLGDNREQIGDDDRRERDGGPPCEAAP
jgi:hypothetical protein